MKNKFFKYFPQGLLPGKIIPFAHKGDWAVHEVLPFIFSQVGPFHLSMATFNVSEDSLRPIFFMRERNELISVRFLFDTNVRRHKLDMLLFSSNIADEIRTTSTHMKVLLCENKKICLALVGSANMNKNIRHEAGIITTNKSMYNFYKDYFQHVFYGDSQPVQLIGYE